MTLDSNETSERRRISVVIPTFQRHRALIRTIEQVRRQLRDDDELLIVDQRPNHPPEVTAQLLALRDDSRVRWVVIEQTGLPLARNVGAMLSVGEVVLYLDDDIDPGAGVLECHRKHFLDPSVGGVAGHVQEEGRPRFRPKGEFVRSGAGCHMSFLRTAIEQAGGFDALLIGNFRGEEQEFAERVRRRGWRIVNGQDCLCVHRPEKNAATLNGIHDDNWHYASIHNFAYWHMKRPFPAILLALPRHVLFTLRYTPISLQQLRRDRFWRRVVLRGLSDALQTARRYHGQSFLQPIPFAEPLRE